MNGVSIVETQTLEQLIAKVGRIEEMFKVTVKQLDDAKKPWMTLKEVCEYLGKGSTWVDQNKGIIGFAKAGGEIRFKRKDVDAYLEGRYFKSKTR